MTNKEIASRILVHLKKFEADPMINKAINRGGLSLPRYYQVNAYGNPRGVSICYISFQGKNQLSKEEATRYLDWLDKGKIGTHLEVKK